MKKILFIFSCIIITSALQAQVLWGTTEYGGVNGSGTISKFITSTSKLTAAFSFDAPDAANPYYSAMVQATNGKLYGMTYAGGINDAGIIFSFDPATATYKNLWSFDGTNGGSPYGSLMQATDGKLYGMTAYGGSSYVGVIFSFDPATATYTKLKEFDGTDGGYPEGSLIQGADGKLYGMTTSGGSNSAGVIFSFDPGTATYTKLKDFSDADGSYPGGDLVQEAASGKLYGTTYSGGSNGVGVVFSFDPATATYTDLKDLDNTADGGNPNGSLVQATNGKFYGTAYSGGNKGAGVVFSFDPATATYTNLKDLDNTVDGGNPSGSLVLATNGKFYGTTVYGGSKDAGVIFSFDPVTATYTKLKNLGSTADGTNPYGSLVQASNGRLYGMTYYGGNSDEGVLFSLDPATDKYTVKRDFGVNKTGNDIKGGLVKDNTGKLLYGMTSSGGSYDAGVIFSFNPATASYKKLKDFNNTNGANPYGSLILASDGKLYGMTVSGGSNSAGVIFSFDPATSTYMKLKEFDNSNSDGARPFGSLVQATDGKLYGMTSHAAGNNYGDIFSFDPVTSTFTKLMDFDYYTTGGSAYGSLVQATDGKLYGMTENGGNFGFGAMFSFDPVTATYTKLEDFDYTTTGAYPYGSLMQATDGKLYGTTLLGAGNNYGGIFSFNPVTATYTVLKNLNPQNGSAPKGSLMQASNGRLYGMTSADGSNGDGVVFSLDPVTANYAKLQEYNGKNGNQPVASFTELTLPPTISINNVTTNESNNGSKIIKFNVSLSTASAQTVQVSYNTADNTATAPSDYTAATGTLTFAPGVKTMTVPVTIIGDLVFEPDETFKILLNNPVNATIKDGTGVCTILNDDVATTSTLTAKDTYNSSTPSIAISPNPATSITNVQLTGYTGSVVLQLTDMQGKVIKEIKVHATNMKYAQQEFNVASVANGTYFMVVFDEQGNKKTEKVIVAH